MEITIYEGEDGKPKVQVTAEQVVIPEDVARAFKAVRKELKKEEE